MAAALAALIPTGALADEACTFDGGVRVSGTIALIAVAGGLFSIELRDAEAAVELGPTANKPPRAEKCMILYMSGFGEVPLDCQNGRRITASGPIAFDSGGTPVVEVDEMVCD